MSKYLFTLLSTILLVTANPLYQASQPCPGSYQQNNFRGLPNNLRNVQQVSHPYTIVQNPTCQSKPPIQNQELLENILSNPTLRMILDPNTKLYNQNGVPIPRHVSENTPNIINNYIIVPPELLIENNKPNSTKIRSKKKPRRPKKKKSNENNREADIESNKEEATENETVKSEQDFSNVQQDKCENGINQVDEKDKHQNEGKINGPNNQENDICSALNNNLDKGALQNEYLPQTNMNTGSFNNLQLTDKNNQRNISKTVQNCNCVDGLYGNYYEQIMKDFAPGINYRTQNGQMYNSPQNMIQSLKPYNKTNNVKNTKSKPNDIQLTINAVQKPKKQYKDEAIIQDLRNRFPDIPEEVVRNILDYLNEKTQKNELKPNFYYPQFPLPYDQLYQTPRNNRQKSPNSSKNGRKKKKRNQRRKTVNNTNHETKKGLTSNLNKKNDNNVTTEKNPVQETNATLNTISDPRKQSVQSNTNENIKEAFNSIADAQNIDSRNKTFVPFQGTLTTENKNDAINTISATYIFEKPKKLLEETDDNTFNTHMNRGNRLHPINNIPELGTEDVVPTIYANGIIEDYYPDFTLDNQAIINDEDHIKFQEHDHYHQMKHDIITNEKTPESENVKENEDIEFITPPLLGEPDFKTRNVRDYNSDNPNYFSESNEKTSTNSDEKHGAIETIYGHSKVAKFGSNTEISEEKAPEQEAANSNNENKYSSRYKYVTDGDKTVVFAHSYPEK